MSSKNSDSFNSFPIQIYFTSFSCLTAVARASFTMLNKSQSEYAWPDADVRRNALSFLSLSMILAVALSCMALFMLGYIYSIPILLRAFFIIILLLLLLLLLLLSRFSRVQLCATHRRQPTRLPCPWDSPGKNIGVGCHFLLQCMKVKS